MEKESTKICARCYEEKPHSAFAKKADTTDKLQGYCRKCNTENHREHLRNNPEVRERALERTREWRKNNKELNKKLNDAWREVNPMSVYLIAVRRNAKRAGVPFDLTLADFNIPTFCPILGIELLKNKHSAKDNSPSVDRIIPELGYVKGNVQIISMLANKMKNSANFEQLRMFAKWVLINIPKKEINGNT